MRHLDLLALAIGGLPHGDEQAALMLGQMSKEQLARWLLDHAQEGNIQ